MRSGDFFERTEEVIKLKLFVLVVTTMFMAGCAELQKNAEEGLDNASEIPDKVWTSK